MLTHMRGLGWAAASMKMAPLPSAAPDTVTHPALDTRLSQVRPGGEDA